VHNNPIQFAVVREDPDVEATLIRRAAAKNALLIASGGCTALTLGAKYPDLGITLVDPNPAQLQLVRDKVTALRSGADCLNVEDTCPTGLNACGNFESLFRGLRLFIEDFVLPADELRALFVERRLYEAPERLFASPYWAVGFDLFFADSLLVTMFGPDAVQHAEPGSYPGYFRGVFERGLVAPEAHSNPFLHHVLLGCYLRGCEPAYITLPRAESSFTMICATLQQVDVAPFDFVSLSNILDWTPPDGVRSLAGRLGDQLRSGATIVMRQLNNDADLEAAFGPRFDFDRELGAELTALDRSLFYCNILAATRR